MEKERPFTKMENHFLEALCKARLNGCEYAVLLAIIRKTLGWHKTSDMMTCAEISRMTGIRRAGDIARTTASLEHKGWIRKQCERGKPTTYYLLSESNSELATSENAITSTSEFAITYEQSNSENAIHKRKGIKQSTNIKGANAPRGDPLVAKFIDGLREKFTEPAIDAGKIAGIVKGLRRSCSEESISGVMDSFFASTDTFIVDAGYEVGIFKLKYNALKEGPLNGNKACGKPRVADTPEIADARARAAYWKGKHRGESLRLPEEVTRNDT